jgi:hypothetical protein
MLYLLTFALGMAAFWISGHVSLLLTHGVKDHTAYVVLGLVATGGVYGLGMFALALAVQRRLGLGVVLATGLAVGLGLLAAQLILRAALALLHGPSAIGILTFVLYLVYGGIYAVSLAVGRRFAK